ncbi:MAG TPA: fused MFS/spermidine synthase [Gemmatimonadales bacterium]|jgi:predicted membrane-bound spermidine synthase|nr:fused MFS/spermidine synthase [Gemmatimonadales bacterium]
MRSRDAFGFGLLFFLSGATGLVYELLWVRVLYQAFGSTIQSVTTVVAAYMGGLGLGAWLLGRSVDRHPRPAALYGWLEIAIGAFGAISPLVLALAHVIYVGVAGALGLGTGAASVALRFGLAALVLLVPTTLMGGTLPILTRAFMGDDRARLKTSLARLYGLNTLGAVVGTALAGFVLIEHVGVRASLWITAATNLALGAAAIALAKPLAPVAEAPAPPPVARAVAGDPLRTLALILLGATAFASLLEEIAWTRVLVMIVGGSTYAFTLILLVFLLGIGIGSAIVARRGGTPAETAASAAVAQGVAASGAALLFAFFGILAVYIVAVFQVQFLTATARLAFLGLAVGAVVLVPAVGMGMTFPLLADLVARSDGARAADVGRAYAVNTLGSIAGAVLTGFLLVVWLGTDLTLRLGLVLSGAAALLLAAFAARGVAEGSVEHRRLQVRVLGAALLAVIGLGTAFAAPRWDTRLVDTGPTIYGREPMDAAGLDAFLSHRGARQLAFREGPNATVSVWEGLGRRTLKVNGKVDASDHADMDTQIMLGLAPIAARAEAASALVIGYGSGVTARVLADAPGMRRVRVVEIEPSIVDVGRYFRHVNGAVLERPGVSLVVDDARSALQLYRERFDVIVSEPSNPWVAGIATLYTPEFLRIARGRLADDGVFCQWIQLYQLPLPIAAGIVRNVRAVFPHVEVWFGSPHDLMVLASPQPIHYDAAWLERLLGPGGSHAELAREWLGVNRPAEYFGRFLLADSGAARLAERGTLVHTDDRAALEFVAARRFLDRQGYEGVLDAIIALGQATDARSRSSDVLLANALSVRRGDSRGLMYVEAARRAHPAEVEWIVREALIRLAIGDSVFAAQAFANALARERHPEALLMSGLVALRRGEGPRARALLLEGLARGGDTALAHAGLAVLAAQGSRWNEAALEARRALATARGSFHRPFPFGSLGDALGQLAQQGPPPLADSMLVEAIAKQPGWPRLYELRAVVALRDGRCEEAVTHLVELLEFGIQRSDAPALLAECRGGTAR